MSMYRTIVSMAAAAALVGLAGCSGSNEQAAATPPAAPTPAPAAAPAPPPAPPVNPMAPSTIRDVQTALQQDGLYHGHVDGRWGPQTRRAVTAYQHQNNLPATGKLDQQTLTAMNIGGGGASMTGTNSNMGGGASSMSGGGAAGSSGMGGGAPGTSSGTSSQ